MGIVLQGACGVCRCRIPNPSFGHGHSHGGVSHSQDQGHGVSQEKTPGKDFCNGVKVPVVLGRGVQQSVLKPARTDLHATLTNFHTNLLMLTLPFTTMRSIIIFTWYLPLISKNSQQVFESTEF